MKQVLFIILLWFVFACQNNKPKESNVLKHISQKRLNKKAPFNAVTKVYQDTLQYLEEGENEDNLFSVFLTKKLDTITIVLKEVDNLENTAHLMFDCEWEYKRMTSGGDEEHKYQQAFMRKIEAVNFPTFKKYGR